MSLSEPTTILWLHISEWALLAFGLLLVLGLIGEYRLLHGHPRLKLFALLVLFGCGGELVCDAGIFLFSEHLQSIQQSVVSDLSTLASEADTKAKAALIDSGTAIKQSDEAESKSQIASDAAGKAQTVANGASTEADAAKESAESVGTLEAKLRTEVEKDDLILLANSSGHTFRPKTFDMLNTSKPANVTVQVLCGMDTQTTSFAKELVEELNDMGWPATLAICELPDPSLDSGVTIFNRSIESKDFKGIRHPLRAAMFSQKWNLCHHYSIGSFEEWIHKLHCGFHISRLLWTRD